MSDIDAWGYVRLSQRGRDGSLDEQKEVVRNYCRRTDGLRLVTTLNDGDLSSGFDADRDQWQLLQRKIQDGSVDAVVVRDRARLSRDFDERISLLVTLRRQQIELHVVEAGGFIDIQDTFTAAMEVMHAAMDHQKKRMEIQRSKEATQERIENGYWMGRTPFGFTLDDEKKYLVKDEDEFQTAIDVLELRGAGASYSEIAAETGVARSTARVIVEREEMYRTEADA